MRKTFRFYKDSINNWYIDLPEWKGDHSELQMVEGADTMLDMIAENNAECRLEMSDEFFDATELLTLIHKRDKNLGGGGDYLLENYWGENISKKIWLCDVTAVVFGKLPEKIWFKKA